MTLDLSDPKDARAYVRQFEICTHHLSYMKLDCGRKVSFKTMTDDDAVLVANELFDMEEAAAKRALKH